MEDSSVLEVGDLGLGIESESGGEALATGSLDLNVLANLEVSSVELNGEFFSSSETELISTFSILELERDDSHTNKVGSVDSLVGLSNGNLDSLEVGSLGSPISGRSRSVLFSGEDDELLSSFLVLHGGVEDSESLLTIEGSLGAFSGGELVDESDIGESTSGHDFVISSSSTVSVEILGLNTSLLEVSCSRRVLGDLTSRRDVIGGNRISNIEKSLSINNILNFRELHVHS